MSILSYILVKAGLSERRKDRRVPSRGLEAIYWTGQGEKHAKIKDISATGIYLVTEDRWPPGTVVLLTLRRRGLREKEARPQVRFRARSVRIGNDGVGLTFLREAFLAEAWSKSVATATELFAGSHPVCLFRAAKAIAFLLRISPPAEAPLISLLAGLCLEKAENLIEIALQADELLESSETDPATRIDPNLVLRILDEASKASDEQVQHCWAGLLASSCTPGPENPSLRFVSLMSKLDRDHVAILTAACARAMRAGWQPGFIFPSPLSCSAEEIRKISGIRNLVAIEGNLNHLYLLGVLEKTSRPFGCAQIEQVNMTPTGLGLNLYVRWSGQNEVPEALDSTALELAS
jgi:hypothetical protein